jgi:hypothetical protein
LLVRHPAESFAQFYHINWAASSEAIHAPSLFLYRGQLDREKEQRASQR